MASTRIFTQSKSVRPVLGAIGDSITAGGYAGSSYFGRLGTTAGDMQFYPGGNFAVSGKRSDEILASQVPSAVAIGAATVSGGITHCVTQFGTNDIAQSVAESTLRANAIAIWAALRAAGIEPIDIGLNPVSSAGNSAKAAGHNAWRQNYCKKNGILHVNIWPVLASSGGVGGYASGLGYDTVHPNSVGQKLIATALRTAMTKPYATTPLLAQVDDRTFSSMPNTTSLLSNAVSFFDTDANGIADNFFAVGSGGTYTVQAVDSGGFGKWQRCAMTAGSTVGFSGTGTSLTTLGWAIGDKLRASFRMRWVDVSQALAVSAKFTGITAAAGSDVNSLFGELAGTATGDDIYVEHDCVIGGGTVVNYQFTASGTGYFEVNTPIVVNLTQLGLA